MDLLQMSARIKPLHCMLLVCFLVSACSEKQAGHTPVSSRFPLKLLWAFDAGRAIQRPPRYGQGIVFVRSDWLSSTTYYALDATNGKLAWQYKNSSNFGFYERSWEIAGDYLIMSNGATDVIAIRLADGKPVWDSGYYNTITSIAANSATVFVSSKNAVTALDLATGVKKWRHTGMPGYSFLVFYNPNNDDLAIPDEKLYLLDASTGDPLSTVDANTIKDCPDVINTLQFYDGRLYCYSRAFDAEKGDLLWNTNLGASTIWHSLIETNTMYLRTYPGSIEAIDLKTGLSRWSYFPIALESSGTNPAAICDVAVVNGVGYTIADDATLRAFDVSNGQELGWWRAPSVVDWRSGPGDSYSNSTPLVGVVSDQDHLFASFGGKTLYAFGP